MTRMPPRAACNMPRHVKRLIVLLIVLAGGLAAACFAVPSNAATVNGESISQDAFNSDLNAIAGSADYRCFLTAEEAVASGGQTSLPSIEGSGQSGDGTSNPTVSTSFAAYYLDNEIGHQLVLQLAAGAKPAGHDGRPGRGPVGADQPDHRRPVRCHGFAVRLRHRRALRRRYSAPCRPPSSTRP